VREPAHCLPFLQSGRLLQVSFDGADWGLGALVGLKKRKAPQGSPSAASAVTAATVLGAAEDEEQYMEVLLQVQAVTDATPKEQLSAFSAHSRVLPKTAVSGAVDNSVEVVQVSLRAIQSISAIRLNLPRDLNKESARNGVAKALQEVQRRYSTAGVPLLDPVTDMGITSDAFKTLQDREAELQSRLQANALSRDPTEERMQALNAYGTRVALLEEARVLRHQARESQAVAMREDLRRMKRVLKRLGYITPEGVLGPKGRFSCELSTGDELVLTDMVFDGVFNALTVEAAVALLSCFVHKEASKDDTPKVQEELKLPFQQLQMAARNVAKVSIDAKMTLVEDEYVASFNPGMVGVVYSWCQGAKFADICALTNIFEGSIIRNIRRLEELLRQLASASLAIGNQELKAKFEAGADKIRRGVVFAASLYL